MSEWNGARQIFRRQLDGGEGRLLAAAGTPSHVRVSGDGRGSCMLRLSREAMQLSTGRPAAGSARGDVPIGEYSATPRVGRNVMSSLMHIWEPDGSGSVLCGDPVPTAAVSVAVAETMKSALLCPRCLS